MRGSHRVPTVPTYAHVTAKSGFSGVGKVRGFFGATGALVGLAAEVAMPRVETGSDDDCDPYRVCGVCGGVRRPQVVGGPGLEPCQPRCLTVPKHAATLSAPVGGAAWGQLIWR